MHRYFREPFNGISHFLAALLALPGLGALLWLGRGDLPRQLSLFLYGVSLILMFAASAAYHLVQAGPGALRLLRKLDHTAIYLLIAGTYTPICTAYFTGAWLWGILGAVWALALIGIAGKLFWINQPRWFSVLVYLLMGWLALAGIGEIVRQMPPAAIAWLVAGGVAYSLGAVVYVMKKPDFLPGKFGFHEIWHLFVILGALCHYILVAAFAALH